MQLSSHSPASRGLTGPPAAHSSDGHPPPHFYGELVRTEEGCKYLRAASHLEDFAAIVSLHEDSDLDADYVVMLKAVLWALVSPLVTPTKDMARLTRLLSAGARRLFVARFTSARRVRPLDSDCPDCGILAGVFATRVGGKREEEASSVTAADSCPLRRTATFALCLLTSTEEGAEILDELGWESVFDLYSRPVGLCVPTYLADYIAVSVS